MRGVGEYLGDVVDEAWVTKLPPGQVHGEHERLEVGHRRLPALDLPARLVEHPGADGHDEAGLLGDRDEVAREEQPAFGVLPAQQCLDTD